MKRKRLMVLTGMVLVLSMLIGCGKTQDGEEKTPANKSATDASKVYLITMDQMDQHWVNLDSGCKKAVSELSNIDYTWLAPDVKDDAKQIECVNNAIAGGADAIIIAANGPDAITATLEEAVSSGIKIIYVDSPANMDAEATFSTDNKAAGETAGEKMISDLKAKGITSGKIGIVNTNAASMSTVLREEGFRSSFEGTDFTILETQYCEGDAAKAKDITANYITAGCVGVFGANEGSSTGVGNAIQEAGDEKVVGVGFDKSDTILQLIKDGHLSASMAQNPDIMGYEGMKAAAEVLSGKDLQGKVTDTGVSVITKDNVQDFIK